MLPILKDDATNILPVPVKRFVHKRAVWQAQIWDVPSTCPPRREQKKCSVAILSQPGPGSYLPQPLTRLPTLNNISTRAPLPNLPCHLNSCLLHWNILTLSQQPIYFDIVSKLSHSYLVHFWHLSLSLYNPSCSVFCAYLSSFSPSCFCGTSKALAHLCLGRSTLRRQTTAMTILTSTKAIWIFP